MLLISKLLNRFNVKPVDPFQLAREDKDEVESIRLQKQALAERYAYTAFIEKAGDRWFWYIQSGNKKIVAGSSFGYIRRNECRLGLLRLIKNTSSINIIEE